MILGIFRRNNIFIDENVLFPCQHKIREYYPIREKHYKFAFLVMKTATTFTVRLAYRHHRNTRLVQFLVNAYMYVLLFVPRLFEEKRRDIVFGFPSFRPSFRLSVPLKYYVPCVRNSSYSFMPIHLKLYRCFCHGLKICMWFGYYPEIIFCHFFPSLNLAIFQAFLLSK